MVTDEAKRCRGSVVGALGHDLPLDFGRDVHTYDPGFGFRGRYSLLDYGRARLATDNIKATSFYA